MVMFHPGKPGDDDCISFLEVAVTNCDTCLPVVNCIGRRVNSK